MRQELKNYLRLQRSDVLIEYIADEKNQVPDIVDEITNLMIDRNDKEDMIALASIVKGSYLEKIKRIAINRKDIDFIVRLAMIPNIDWKDLEDTMIGIFLEKQEKIKNIPSDELYMATIFYKNHLDAIRMCEMERIILQSKNYNVMACFVSNVSNVHIEKFEQAILSTERVQLLRQWKDLVGTVSPEFEQKLENLEHHFSENIDILKNWIDHREEADERRQTVESLSSKIIPPKEAEQPIKSSRQKIFPFWKRK